MHKYLLTIIFLLFYNSSFCFQNGNDSFRIVKNLEDNNHYLHYHHRGIDKSVLLPYPFDSAFLNNGIIFDSQNKISNRSFVYLDNYLLISVSDFNFSNKIILFIINETKNKVMEIGKRNDLYLETGLPYFIITDSRLIVNSNSFSFINDSKEDGLLHYYVLNRETINWIKDKKLLFHEADISIDSFINKKLVEYILK